MDIEGLERLGRLRQAGAIGEEEFEAEKQRILNSATTLPAETIRPETYSEGLAQTDVPKVNTTTRRRFRIAMFLLLAVSLVAVLGVAAGRYSGLIKISRSLQSGSSLEQYTVHSKVKRIHIGLASDLPRNPHLNDPSCASYEKSANGQAGKLVSSAGWHITSEGSIGKFNAVSFVGACSPVSPTKFDPIDANVGLYDGDKLIAIIYGKGIGSIERDPDPMRLQIKRGSGDNIIGTIVLDQSSITIDK